MPTYYPVKYLEGQILEILKDNCLSTKKISDSIIKIDGKLPSYNMVRNALHRLKHYGFVQSQIHSSGNTFSWRLSKRAQSQDTNKE